MSTVLLWLEILKVVSPVFVALIGAFAALKFNDFLKRKELIYKEKVDAFNKFVDKIFELRRLLTLLWNPGAAKRNKLNILEVVAGLESLENYLEFNSERYTILFSNKIRSEVLKIQHELGIVLDYYIPAKIDIPAVNFISREEQERFGLDETHSRELQDSILSALARIQSSINLLLTEINLPKSQIPFITDEVWLKEREKRRIHGKVVRG